jgi:hypothetical protein
MTQDEIVALAREAHISAVFPASEKSLERFANLVAQEVRDRIMFGSRDDWVLAEREACAKIVEDSPSYDWHKFACEAAAAIRARGEQA